jgi:hypothetical protein
VASL